MQRPALLRSRISFGESGSNCLVNIFRRFRPTHLETAGCPEALKRPEFAPSDPSTARITLLKISMSHVCSRPKRIQSSVSATTIPLQRNPRLIQLLLKYSF